jgi:uncharacterized protein
VTLAHNVSELLKSAPGAARQVTIDEPHPRLGPDLQVTRPIQGTARLLRTQNGIVVRSRLATTVNLDCARCLDPVERDLTIDLDEEFRPSVHILTGAPLEAPEDEALRIDERHLLDLTEAVRQYLATSIPLQPLCSTSCQGLCPVCGMNLNEGNCRCDAASVAASGPFAALAGLIQPDQDQPGGADNARPRAQPRAKGRTRAAS